MSVSQSDLHHQLRARSIATRMRIADMVRPLDLSQLGQHPVPHGWSIGDVLEHLCVSQEAYASPMRGVLRNARMDAAAPAREWRPTLLGRLVVKGLERPQPMKAAAVFSPGPTPRNGVVEAFVEVEMAFVQRMDDCASYDWRALRLGSPALPKWMPRFNLGDVFRVHVVHVARHEKQIARTIAQLS